MKCPRTFQIEITEDDQIKLIGADCLKADCAWWDDENGECDFKVARRNLGLIALALSEIAKKMPHEGQFKDK